MSADLSVDEVAEEFARRCRAGETPSVDEYAARYPTHADDLRAVLPAVAAMERAKPHRPAPPPPLRPPDRVGDYRILGQLGRGGMGVVYEAEHAGLGRRVALKVLPGHLVADDRLKARFVREARAAARLHHTNIVPVFEAGEADGHAFYAMQLIRGRSLVGDPGPFDHLPPRDRGRAVARAGVEAADALAHAHAHGVLHRDVKPSNLLLDDAGVTWVTDFGVAKLVEDADLTRSGDLVGTLRYMPPERFDGVSDARGDVYGLGVTLYELLAGRPAFPDTTPHQLIHLITRADLPPLRPLTPGVPADLETVVLKATAREPGRRYPTAAALADDLRRFLDDRPVKARRIGPAGRAWRWARRNPALAGASAAVFVLMATTTVVSVVAYVRTAAANAAAAAALTAETAEREHAETTADLALAGLNRTFDRFAPTRLVATPTATADDGTELPPAPALPPEVVPLLEDLLRTYEPIARSAAQFPRLWAQAAEANHRIGDIRQRLGRLDGATDAYQTACELYERLPPDGPDRVKLARASNDLGRVLRTLRRHDEARAAHERAVRVLADAPAEFAARPECRFELARTLYTLAERDAIPDHPPSKGKHHPPPHFHPDGPPPPHEWFDHPAREAVGLLEDLVRDHPKVAEYRHLLACCYRDLPGPRSADRAVGLLRELVREYPNVPDYAFDLCEGLARPWPPRKAKGGPRAGLAEAVRLSGELVARYPTVPGYVAAHARYTDLQGYMAFESGDPATAEGLHRKAIGYQAELVRQNPGVVAYEFWMALMERSLGRAVAARGELVEARTSLRSAVDRLEALRRADPELMPVRPMLGTAYRELAGVLDRAGDLGGAADARAKAAAFPDRPLPPPKW